MQQTQILAAIMLFFACAIHSSANAQTPSADPKSAGDSAALNLWAAQTDPGSVRLVWNHLNNVVGYAVSCEIGSRPLRKLADIPTALVNKAGEIPRRMSYVVAARELDVAYRCFLQWRRDAKGLLSTPVAFNVVSPVSTAGTRAAAPAAVTARATAPGEITVTWEAVPNATAYTILRAVAPNGFRMFCDLCPSANSIVDRSAVAGAKHAYAITPLTPAGAGARTTSNTIVAAGSMNEIITGSDPGVGDLRRPTDVNAVITAPTTISVTWSAVDIAASYDVYRSANKGALVLVGRVRNGAPRSTIEFIDYVASLLPSAPVSVSYAVKSVDGTGHATEPGVSNVVDLSLKDVSTGTAINNASNTKAIATSANSVTLTWSPPLGAVSCSLKRSLSGGNFAALPAIGPGTISYIDTAEGLMTFRPRYQIVCTTPKSTLSPVAFPNPEWDTNQAPAVDVASSKTVPTNLRAVATSSDSVTLTWGPPTTAVACTVQRSIDGAAYASIATLAIGAFRHIDTSTGLMSRRPRYQLACGGEKGSVVRFPEVVVGR